MKKIYLISLMVFAIPLIGKSQVFVSDSVKRFSVEENKIIETLPDTTYTIERTFGIIYLSHRKYGMSLGKFKRIDDVKWSIKIDKRSLPNRKGNTKEQVLEGWLEGGIKKLERVGWRLVDRDNDGKFESLEYKMIESSEIESTIFCHLK